MTFKNRLNEYLNNINCSSKELSIKSNVSESVISRYRNGDRTPKIDSKQLKDIPTQAAAFFKISKAAFIFAAISFLRSIKNSS